MIAIDLPARMTCMEQGCTDTSPVHLVLLANGTIGFKPESRLWQVAVTPSNAASPYMCRCPKHATKVQPVQTHAPALQRVGH